MWEGMQEICPQLEVTPFVVNSHNNISNTEGRMEQTLKRKKNVTHLKHNCNSR